MYIFMKNENSSTTLVNFDYKTSLCNKKKIATHEHRTYLFIFYIVFIYLGSIHFLFHDFIFKVD